MSVMNGFREELIKSLSGINGDFIIYETNDQEISKFQQTYPDAKIVKNYQQRVITTNDRGIEGLLMKSMTIEDFYKIPRLNENLFEIENVTESWVFIGTELARSLDVKVGDSLQISIPGSSMTILGPVLNSHILIIKGIFNTGIYDYDKYFIYSNENYFKDISDYPVFEVYEGNTKIDSKDLSPMIYDTWSDQNQSLAQALATEKNVMFIILFFIILISSFTIISNQIFFIKEKYKDIVLLKSLGISQMQICSLCFSLIHF